MGHSEGQIYGYLHMPCRVEVNARLGGVPAEDIATAGERKLG
jgi:hypothetical protein